MELMRNARLHIALQCCFVASDVSFEKYKKVYGQITFGAIMCLNINNYSQICYNYNKHQTNTRIKILNF